jgi:hypothetical protein
MDVIARCYAEHILADGRVTVGGREVPRRPSLRHGANLETAERVFVWPIEADIAKRGTISTSMYAPIEKRFEIQAAFDADAPTYPF